MIRKLTFIFVACLLQLSTTAQDKGFYGSQEWEIIFSFAEIDNRNETTDNIIRWSPVFNIMGYTNYDLNKNFGLFAGFGIRNVGFIADFPERDNDERTKYRTYNAGVPVGFKIGNLDQAKPRFLYAGYEFELPFHYKEKRFVNGNKEQKISAWFTNRTDIFTQSLFVGFQTRSGMALKFKYYLDSFFNEDYEEFVDGPDGNRIAVKPFQNFTANVFYISLSFYPFRNLNILPDKDKKEEFISVKY